MSLLSLDDAQDAGRAGRHAQRERLGVGRDARAAVQKGLDLVEAVLDNIMESYISGFIYSALIDSFCSEQNARMTAMDAANRNAEKLLGELSLQYNRVRQADITQEITEDSAGAQAQRRKHRKEA